MRINFIGLSNMDAFMAKRLLDAGHELFVFDLEPAAMQNLADHGAHLLPGIDASGRQQLEVIFTMLPAAAQVNEVYLGPKGLFTLLQILNAPVPGKTVGSKENTLTFMMGGPQTHAASHRISVCSHGQKHHPLHDNGHGQVAKIANNMLLGISMIGVAETMSLDMSLGMDPRTLAEVINHSSGRCWSSDTNNPVPGICPQ